MSIKELPIPKHFDPAAGAEWGYRPKEQDIFTNAPLWAKVHGVRPAGSDKKRFHLLLIDVQNDFTHPEGTLYVGGRSGRGALEDNRRIAEFIYRNLGVITDVTVTMDTHFPFQIFFTSFWLDASGDQPAPHQEITIEDLRQGRLRPNPVTTSWLCGGNYPWLQKQVEFYCEELEREGKYRLYLWPPHCLLGGPGHALAGVVQEARLFHALARGAHSSVEIKGGNPLTENYSVFRPEVLMRWDRKPLDQKNTKFVETLLRADTIAIAGQARSHCVASTINDLLQEIGSIDSKLAEKVYIMTDCMSAVAVPDGQGGFVVDFTPQADAATQRFKDAGMHLVESTQPVESWPGIKR